MQSRLHSERVLIRRPLSTKISLHLLIKVDLSECSLVALPSEEIFKGLVSLKVLFLHSNKLSKIISLEPLKVSEHVTEAVQIVVSEQFSVVYLTLFNNPLPLTKTRHFVVNVLPQLMLLDDTLVKVDERYEGLSLQQSVSPNQIVPSIGFQGALKSHPLQKHSDRILFPIVQVPTDSPHQLLGCLIELYLIRRRYLRLNPIVIIQMWWKHVTQSSNRTNRFGKLQNNSLQNSPSKVLTGVKLKQKLAISETTSVQIDRQPPRIIIGYDLSRFQHKQISSPLLSPLNQILKPDIQVHKGSIKQVIIIQRWVRQLSVRHRYRFLVEFQYLSKKAAQKQCPKITDHPADLSHHEANTSNLLLFSSNPVYYLYIPMRLLFELQSGISEQTSKTEQGHQSLFCLPFRQATYFMVEQEEFGPNQQRSQTIFQGARFCQRKQMCVDAERCPYPAYLKNYCSITVRKSDPTIKTDIFQLVLGNAISVQIVQRTSTMPKQEPIGPILKVGYQQWLHIQNIRFVIALQSYRIGSSSLVFLEGDRTQGKKTDELMSWQEGTVPPSKKDSELLSKMKQTYFIAPTESNRNIPKNTIESRFCDHKKDYIGFVDFWALSQTARSLSPLPVQNYHRKSISELKGQHSSRARPQITTVDVDLGRQPVGVELLNVAKLPRNQPFSNSPLREHDPLVSSSSSNNLQGSKCSSPPFKQQISLSFKLPIVVSRQANGRQSPLSFVLAQHTKTENNRYNPVIVSAVRQSFDVDTRGTDGPTRPPHLRNRIRELEKSLRDASMKRSFEEQLGGKLNARQFNGNKKNRKLHDHK